MAAGRHLVIIRGTGHQCSEETNQVKAIADMLGMSHELFDVNTRDELDQALRSHQKAHYMYFCAHAHADEFEIGDSPIYIIDWSDFAVNICDGARLYDEAVLFLACCRGGNVQVAQHLFGNCMEIDYVLGPRWKASAHDLVVGFHVFLYNVEVRGEQPSRAAERASQATGYDFYCHDRTEYT